MGEWRGLVPGVLATGLGANGLPKHLLGWSAPGGCHCSRCLGANKQEVRGKWPEEDQSQDVGSGSLAEHCYATENSVGERRIISNLEKAMQAAFNFTSGGEEVDNSL